MKRILLLAAGALGTAGMIAMAAPASADTGVIDTQFGQFTDSIDPEKAVNTFLNGSCANYPKDKCPVPVEERRPGVSNQFDFFRQNLQSQSTAFTDSIDPSKQLDKFVKSITTPPSVGEDKKPS